MAEKINQRVAVTKRLLKESLIEILSKKDDQEGHRYGTLSPCRHQQVHLLCTLQNSLGYTDRNQKGFPRRSGRIEQI